MSQKHQEKNPAAHDSRYHPGQTAAHPAGTGATNYVPLLIVTMESLLIPRPFLPVLDNTFIAKVQTSPTSLSAPFAENNISVKPPTL